MINKIFYILFISFFFILNILVKPQHTICPSDFYVNNVVSAGVWHYRHSSPVDFLILGNSRAKDSLDPDIIEQVLNRDKEETINVQTISVGGGFFPFYYEFLNSVIRNNLPKSLILSISPRDFNKKEDRVQKVSNYLINSYGYKLDHKPYNVFFKLIEKKLTNIFAALFPLFFYETSLKNIFFTRKSDLHFLHQQYGLNKYIVSNLEYLITLIPTYHFKFEKPLLHYIDFYFKGILNSIHPSIPEKESVRPDGFQIFPPVTSNELAKNTYENQIKWKSLLNSGTVTKYRNSPDCDSAIQLDTNENSQIIKTFDLLQENKVSIYIVQLPAIWLEGCENNLKFGKALSNYLITLKARYPNIISIIDLNKNFHHNFTDFSIYSDLEHLYPHKANLFSLPLAENIKIVIESAKRKKSLSLTR
ncbi:MAG: hypothetical protein A2381_01260 [Bdellovibrionales bacterium RIFOXYB1_FULL_37_110]|nr:MAG: hypothetical protein A2417_02115 [Bdellovibrionales bacterium RIFOXYC1_FULL_37_79]OFZ58845.1 MAG: hypothetical protein A2381_01260 [Bdellovibrionales bacterium RIFOXYB1_FULL_37_110]OFZ64844.1 MAG: hypothetical protein A2577_07260 [Bdellovibrionales bacterium RIFOXYD1_FULL_36_51]